MAYREKRSHASEGVDLGLNMGSNFVNQYMDWVNNQDKNRAELQKVASMAQTPEQASYAAEAAMQYGTGWGEYQTPDQRSWQGRPFAPGGWSYADYAKAAQNNILASQAKRNALSAGYNPWNPQYWASWAQRMYGNQNNNQQSSAIYNQIMRSMSPLYEEADVTF